MSAVLKSRSTRLALAARAWRLRIDSLELNTTCAGSPTWSDQLHREPDKAGSPRAFRRSRSFEKRAGVDFNQSNRIKKMSGLPTPFLSSCFPGCTIKHIGGCTPADGRDRSSNPAEDQKTRLISKSTFESFEFRGASDKPPRCSTRTLRRRLLRRDWFGNELTHPMWSCQ
jgi:hypothetical protein